MFSVLTGRTNDMTWPDNGDQTIDIMTSRYDACDGHGGSDVFPFGLLDTDIDGWAVRNRRGAIDMTALRVPLALSKLPNLKPLFSDPVSPLCFATALLSILTTIFSSQMPVLT